jgi:hypothetical protein
MLRKTWRGRRLHTTQCIVEVFGGDGFLPLLKDLVTP